MFLGLRSSLVQATRPLISAPWLVVTKAAALRRRAWQRAGASTSMLAAVTGRFTGGSGLRVLIVDDNASSLALARSLVRNLGHDVAVATNGEEAAVAATREPFDLILMDVEMPVMDGVEATRRIRANQGKAAPRIVAMTAHESSREVQRCRDAGMVDVVHKPLQLDRLRSVLEPSRHGHSPRSPPIMASSPGAIGQKLAQQWPELWKLFDRDEAALTEYLEAVSEECTRAASELEAAVADNDSARAAAAAHRAATSCFRLKRAELGTLLRHVEAEARASASIPAGLTQAKRGLTDLAAEIDAALASNGA